MKDLFRDTVFGRLVYLASRGNLLAYEDELNPSAIEKYTLADSDTWSTYLERTQADAEKGKDGRLVEWAENDPHNPRNWSTPKKLFVTFLICLLTTSVYIGSAIYTAGLAGVQEQFHVSEVQALLGLTLFVLGYALGPMVWVGRVSALHTERVLICVHIGSNVRNALHRS